jgi:Mor family transcriptional regulator
MTKTASELGQLAQRLSDAELRVSTLRGQLDAVLFADHRDGMSIAELARATGLSRQTIYTSIERHRAQLDA